MLRFLSRRGRAASHSSALPVSWSKQRSVLRRTSARGVRIFSIVSFHEHTNSTAFVHSPFPRRRRVKLATWNGKSKVSSSPRCCYPDKGATYGAVQGSPWRAHCINQREKRKRSLSVPSHCLDRRPRIYLPRIVSTFRPDAALLVRLHVLGACSPRGAAPLQTRPAAAKRLCCRRSHAALSCGGCP